MANQHEVFLDGCKQATNGRLHRALAEGLMKEFELATEANLPPNASQAVYRMDHYMTETYWTTRPNNVIRYETVTFQHPDISPVRLVANK